MRSAIRRSLLVPVALLLVSLGIAGCAGSKTQSPGTSHAVFYPEAPAAPRLQFLASFNGPKDLEGKSEASFKEWVVGAPADAGTGESFTSPYGLAVHDRKLYLCDVGSKRIYVLDLVSKKMTTLQSDKIRNPVNITVGPDGMKYVCDSGAGRVLVFDASDQFLREIGTASGWGPVDLAIDGDELFISDAIGARIEVWSKDGKLLRSIGEKGRGLDQLLKPTNIALSPDHRLYVVDMFQQIVKVFDPRTGQFLGTVGQPGTDIGSFARPKGIAIDDAGIVYVSDAQWDVVQLFNAKGQLMMLFGSPGREPWNLGLPAGLFIDRSSMDVFRPYLATNFQPEYLLFVVNQFGMNKVAVFAFGRDTTLPASAYEVDMDAVARRKEELRTQAKKDQETSATTPR